MIEVLFGESEAASMKFARKNDNCEVVCFGFMLDIGSIKERVDSQYRKNLIYCLYSNDQWGKDSRMDTKLKKVGDAYAKELYRLKEFMREGKTIRIWYSNCPYALCGFYYLCSLSMNYPCDITAVKLPEHKGGKDSVITYNSWTDVPAEELKSYLGHGRRLTSGEIRMYAGLWRELVEDNSPLRAVINGRLTGVEKEFYDFLIWKNLTKAPVKEARLIGDILCNYSLGIGDFWYASRIDHYIKEGRIKVVSHSEKKYDRLICISNE